jgi:hypothetical protein
MSDNGNTKAPARYLVGAREAVDMMRDMAFVTAKEALCPPGTPDGHIRVVADKLFAHACDTHALKYAVRGGRKGDPEGDIEKMAWWRAMAEHARTGSPDPRSRRADYKPYVYPD